MQINKVQIFGISSRVMTSIESVKEKLIETCLNGKASDFIPYLLQANVYTKMPNKVSFYKFFKHALTCAREHSDGPWTLKIKSSKWSLQHNALQYSFFDKNYDTARLNIEIIQKDSSIILETLPF